jgi:hypothetical protein
MRETLKGFARMLTLPARGIGSAARARPWTMLAVVGAALALHIFLPPLLLAATRKPWTYFAFNPWLTRLPDYLISGVPLAEKLDFLSRVAVFWFSADGPYGFPEWGFAVDAMDLIRFVAMSLLLGGYVALMLDRRASGQLAAQRAATSPVGGVVGALAGVLGLSTGPCSVVGCGAPVLPVVGLVFAGLSSATLAALSNASRIASAAVLVTLTLVVVYLGYQSGARAARASPGSGRPTSPRCTRRCPRGRPRAPDPIP